MCRINVIVLSAMVFLLISSPSQGKYSGGTGEPNDPYRIATPNDLNDIGNHVEDFNKYFVMVNDINLADYTGTQFSIIGDSATKFTGIFDGNSRSICNLTYQATTSDYIGLFGCVAQTGHIKDVTVLDPNVKGDDWVGCVVGCLLRGSISGCSVQNGEVAGDWYVGGLTGLNGGTITNCRATVKVNGGYDSYHVGGLVGTNASGGIVSNCYVVGAVTGGDSSLGTGGLVGANDDGTIEQCWSRVSVLGGTASIYVAGIVGLNFAGDVSMCHAAGTVSGGDNSTDLGGLVGENDGSLTNCCAMATVRGANGAQKIGGLVGDTGPWDNCHIEDSYASGSVSGGDGASNLGGLVGYDDSGSYRTCFWDSDVNPDVNGIGNANDPNVIGKTTAEMQTESTFTDAGWDFVEVWDIGDNQTYPFLRKYLAGDLNHDGLVDWRDFAILASRWLEGF
jgi:hypothetical protein